MRVRREAGRPEVISNRPEHVALNVAAWQPRSVANGPGERFVLWVQGCPFRCAGCINQDFLPFVPRTHMTVEEVEDLIVGVPGIEGVTYSGGEPMAQAEGLYHLSCRLKKRGLSIVCYSGFTLEELRKHTCPWTHQLLACLDVLIDGRYEATQRANLPWRASRNQRVHFLTDRYQDLEPQMHEPNADVELIVGEYGFTATGILHQALFKRLEEILGGNSK